MPAISASRYTVTAGWDDVPHLSEAAKAELLQGTPPYLREARKNGIPALGAGAVYPIDWEAVLCDPFPIPAWWRRGYGLDVGWNNTAALWLAEDPETRVRYAFAEYLMGLQLPVVHAAAIKARGGWMRGAIDPASRGRAQHDGQQLLAQYQAAGLNLMIANNGVESGIHGILTKLETGQMRIFRTMQAFMGEARLYRRNMGRSETDPTRGRIVKVKDHLMDAWRYADATFDAIARTKPAEGAPISAALAVGDKTVGY